MFSNSDNPYPLKKTQFQKSFSRTPTNFRTKRATLLIPAIDPFQEAEGEEWFPLESMWWKYPLLLNQWKSQAVQNPGGEGVDFFFIKRFRKNRGGLFVNRVRDWKRTWCFGCVDRRMLRFGASWWRGRVRGVGGMGERGVGCRWKSSWK